MTTVELAIESLAFGGEGVGRLDGRAVFVRGALPGERVRVELDTRDRTLRGRLREVLTPSADRVEPPCEIASRCGGCPLMHASEGARARYRAEVVERELRRALGELPPDVAHHGSPRALGARTRARLRVIGGRPAVVGFVEARGSRVVGVPRCVALDAALAPVFDTLRSLADDARLRAEARVALGAQGLPVISLATEGDPPPSLFTRAERAVTDARVAGISILVGGAKAPAVIGDPTAWTVGADGAPLRVPDGGFAQANPEVSVALGQHVAKVARAAGARVVELFSGAGNLTTLLARGAASYRAVEADAAASRACSENLAARGLSATVVTGDADACELARATEVVVLDPPRAGARRACDAIASSRARRVVYVSCDPTTLGRDARALAASGFRATSVASWDMFPQTAEVETVVAMER